MEWNEPVQRMIDWLEDNLSESPTLLAMSRHIGYSPCYCSSLFHQTVGMTLKSYVANRRLARAALDIRDTRERILDIALRYGFSSQEALTRAFRAAYGCTPSAYRRQPRAIALAIRRFVLFPQAHSKGEEDMGNLTDAGVRVEYIPAHKYLGIWDREATGYCDFWERHDCDAVCGVIDSLSHVSHPVVIGHTAGWVWSGDRRSYFYGLGVPEDYAGEIPEGFELRDIPGSYYLVFFHPVFDYLADNGEVMGRVERLAWNFDPASRLKGYTWNEKACPDYQRHNPERFGYEVLRPIRTL